MNNNNIQISEARKHLRSAQNSSIRLPSWTPNNISAENSNIRIENNKISRNLILSSFSANCSKSLNINKLASYSIILNIDLVPKVRYKSTDANAIEESMTSNTESKQ